METAFYQNSVYSQTLLTGGKVLWLSIVKMRRWHWKTIKRNVPLIFLEPMNKSSICFVENKRSSEGTEAVPKPLKYVTVAGGADVPVTNTGFVGLKANPKFTKVFGL